MLKFVKSCMSEYHFEALSAILYVESFFRGLCTKKNGGGFELLSVDG